MAVETSNLSKTGSSGSPLFTEDGRIMGLHCNGSALPKLDDPETARTISFILNHDGLKKVWAAFPF